MGCEPLNATSPEDPANSETLISGAPSPGSFNLASTRSKVASEWDDETVEGSIPRPIYVRQKDALPVYVTRQGALVGKSGGRLTVRVKDDIVASTRFLDVSSVSLFGNVQISAQAIGALMSREIPISHFTYGGWLKGITTATCNKNIELRIAQYKSADDEERSIRIAKDIVRAKLHNSRVLLRRNCPERPEHALQNIARWIAAIESVDSFDTLLGIEGAAAREYFRNFSTMLKSEDPAFDFSSRNRRPPRDPVNAVLSFLYSVLVNQVLTTVLAVGFDPYLGFYHRPKHGRPSLALDLAEEFRPILADSSMLMLINNGELKSGDFIMTGEAVSLTEQGRKIVLRAFERRMETLVRHPFTGYSISYRRILEVQARLLARHILGELSSYPAFTAR